VVQAEALLPGTIEVVVARIARLASGFDERPREYVDVAQV
jgi:hypothetical protein